MALTNRDLKNVKELFKVTIDEDETLVRKDDIKHLPTKDEFYDKMDEVMGKLKSIREENSVLSGLNEKVNDLDTKVNNLEEKIRIGAAVA